MFDFKPEDLLYKMTSFYQEHLPIDSSLEKLMKIYMKTASMVQKEYEFVNDNMILEGARMMHTIPYFKIDITNGKYNVRRAKQLSLLSFETMLSEMDRNNEYVTLAFEDKESRTPIIYSMDLKISFVSDESLTLYKDYFIRENRLYLLPSFILERDVVVNFLHAFEIKVDRKTLEKNWGSLFKVEAGPLLPRYQYRDVLSAFQRTLSSDLTIKDISDGIRLATKWEEFKIEDIKSPHISIAKKRLYDEWMLSPSKFIATLPEHLIKDKLRLNVLLSLLDEVREVQTNYMVMFDINRKDVMNIPDPNKHMISMKLKDLYTSIDKSSRFLGMTWTDYLFDYASMYDSFLEYDLDGAFYDYKRKQDFIFPTINLRVTDKTSLNDEKEVSRVSLSTKEFMSFENEIIPYFDNNFSYDDDIEYDLIELNRFDSQAKFDTPKLFQADRFMIRQINFPEIPRQFSFSETDESGIYRFECRPNDDGTMLFELHGSYYEEGPYEQLDSRTNDVLLDKIAFIHNANVSGKRYYKIRAVAGSSKSFMTLPINIQPAEVHET